MSSLPMDLIFEILLWVPAVSLLRFRCVSTQFCRRIDSPDFKSLHHDRSVKNDTNLNLILSGNTNSKILSLDLNSVDNIPRELDLLQQGRYLILGACDGFIAVEIVGYGTLLFNPLTRENHILPIIPEDFNIFIVFVGGFGYDIENDDYKVVMGFVPSTSGVNHPQMAIFSLKANSWTKREACPLTWLKFIKGRGIYANGALHWRLGPRCWADDDENGCIIAYDLNCLEFKPIQYPGEILGKSVGLTMENFGGCLSICCYNYEDSEFEIWTLKDHGIRMSWTKLVRHRFPTDLFPHVYAVTYSQYGEKILSVRSDGSFFWYYIKDSRIESIEIPTSRDYNRAMVCTGSLISLNNLNANSGIGRMTRIEGATIYYIFS